MEKGFVVTSMQVERYQENCVCWGAYSSREAAEARLIELKRGEKDEEGLLITELPLDLPSGGRFVNGTVHETPNW